ncbi:MAG TPA: efflux transporter outer membrane subunit [Steroidobacteraceae bacterium]|jgi:NodT family efflux transporter outer membrane factor (OMF) lipoprotein
MNGRRRAWLLAATLSLMLTACAFAPRVEPPAAKTTPTYAAEPASDITVEAAGVAQHLRSGAPLVPDWWRLYGSDTLNAWVDEGLRNNASLVAVQHTWEAGRAQFRAEVGEALLPSIDAGGQVSRQRALGFPDFGPPTNLYDVFAGDLTLSYSFDLFGAARYAVREAAAQLDQQAWQLQGARRALAANIVIAAINAAALNDSLSVDERVAALLHEQAELSEKSYRSGASSNDEVLSAQQSAAALDSSMATVRAQSLHARHALAVLMGRTPDQAPMALSLAQLQLPVELPISVPSDLLRQRPDILAADAVVHAAAAQVGVATAELFPRISLSASLGSESFHSAALFTPQSKVWSAGATLTQPIFHGRALLQQRKAALAQYQASIAQYQQIVLNAFQNVADTLTALDQDARALQSAQLAAAIAHQSFTDSHSRYLLGALSYPATVASEQRWQNAALSEIQQRSARLVDTAGLFQAMGTAPESSEQ